ncbi:MAG TPA: hypothetical protein VJS12_20215 [Steroidobacteraceae bacterium]|nr:hypothetical protein [Steroidobacteraceae bacterium]
MSVRFLGVFALLLVFAGWTDASAQTCPDDRKLRELEQRVKDLEERAARGRLLGSRVYAPFEVVNEAGYRTFMVEDGYVWFYNATGATAARVVMSENGGYFMGVSTKEKQLVATIGAVGKLGNVFVSDKGVNRINLGRNDQGRYGLRIYDANLKPLAGIGQASGGPGDGVVTVGDTQGNQRAAMFVNPDGGGGMLQVLNASGQPVGSLYATKAGNGRMELLNNTGVIMVQAGVNEYNVGVVRAGPAGFHPGVGILGLPGSFIAGKAE